MNNAKSRYIKHIFSLLVILCAVLMQQSYAQSTQVSSVSNPKITLTLDDAISMAQSNSIESMVVQNIFLSEYWSYRSFKSQSLPSLRLDAGIANFNRSLIPLQDATTGVINYRENFNLQNRASLSINQNIAATGGTLSLFSSLNRLDQYEPDRNTTHYSQPITLRYMQPLWSYNALKWGNKIEPHKMEAAKRKYLEGMEAITVNAVNYLFAMAIEEMNLHIAKKNYENTVTLYKIAESRNRLGTLKRNELLQLEGRMLSDSLEINNAELRLTTQSLALHSYLGLRPEVEIIVVTNEQIPELQLDYKQVLEKAFANSSFIISQRIQDLEADKSIALAKANRGFSASIETQFGLSNSASQLKNSYMGLLDQEIVGLTLSLPIMDWGVGKGRVKVAQAQSDMVKNRIRQEQINYEQEILAEVMRFNNQLTQCRISRRANMIAEERYRLNLDSFAENNISVTDFNMSQTEKDEAQRRYINELKNYWLYYYNIRKLSLFDYIWEYDISAEFDKIVNK